MSRGLYALVGAQFLSAFADNAVLFTVVSMVLHQAATQPWYVPALQASFLIAFVLLAPWVGPMADSRPKAQVLLLANGVKALGAAMLLGGMSPLLSYAVVGIGAAAYSPAKYGILPELVGHARLVQANAWVEGFTILAIVAGTAGGAAIADNSVALALGVVLTAYLASMAVTLWVPSLPGRGQPGAAVLSQFVSRMRGLLVTSRARFSLLGASLFWATAALLRVTIIAWAPLVLAAQNSRDIAVLTLYMAVGVVAGSVAAPRIVPIEGLRRARLAAYMMGFMVVVLSLTGSSMTAGASLFLVGVAGGVFLVPINAALQEIGHHTIGSGGAVALQNFFENLAMLMAMAAYMYATALGVSPVLMLIGLGLTIMVATLVISWRLPR